MTPHKASPQAADWVDLVSASAGAQPATWVALEAGAVKVTGAKLARDMLSASARLRLSAGPVAVCSPDPIVHAIGVLGGLAAGRPVVLIDAKHPVPTVVDVLQRAEATTIVGAELGAIEHVSGEELLGNELLAPVRRPPTDHGTTFLTSGSTGSPKLVERSRGADLHGAMCLPLSGFPLGPGDRHWLSVPHSSAAWITLVMGALLVGATTVFAPFRPDLADEFIRERHISSGYFVPTMLRLARAATGLDGPGWLGLRALMTGGEKLDSGTQDDLTRLFSTRLFMGYGMTEAPRVCQADPVDLRERPGTVGRPTPLREVRIAGSAEGVAAGTEGEILVRGPDLFRGYTGESPSTTWHRTGDLGRLDPDGYLYVTGRASRVLNIGGNRVSLDEIEALLRRHPAVRQAAAVAIDDPVWTHRVEAFLVLSGAADPGSVEAWLRERAAAYKIPRHFTVLDQLPVDASGKVSLSLLASVAARGLEPPA